MALNDKKMEYKTEYKYKISEEMYSYIINKHFLLYPEDYSESNENKIQAVIFHEASIELGKSKAHEKFNSGIMNYSTKIIQKAHSYIYKISCADADFYSNNEFNELNILYPEKEYKEDATKYYDAAKHYLDRIKIKCLKEKQSGSTKSIEGKWNKIGPILLEVLAKEFSKWEEADDDMENIKHSEIIPYIIEKYKIKYNEDLDPGQLKNLIYLKKNNIKFYEKKPENIEEKTEEKQSDSTRHILFGVLQSNVENKISLEAGKNIKSLLKKYMEKEQYDTEGIREDLEDSNDSFFFNSKEFKDKFGGLKNTDSEQYNELVKTIQASVK